MSEYLDQIIEDETVTCEVCKKVYKTDEITLDDWEFSWDNHVEEDCCSDCAWSKYKWVFCDDESGIGRDEQYFETYANAKAELQGWVYAYRARKKPKLYIKKYLKGES